MTFKIMGKSPDTEEEEIDQADTREEIDFLLDDYRLAYPNDWSFEVVEE